MLWLRSLLLAGLAGRILSPLGRSRWRSPGLGRWAWRWLRSPRFARRVLVRALAPGRTLWSLLPLSQLLLGYRRTQAVRQGFTFQQESVHSWCDLLPFFTSSQRCSYAKSRVQIQPVKVNAGPTLGSPSFGGPDREPIGDEGGYERHRIQNRPGSHQWNVHEMMGEEATPNATAPRVRFMKNITSAYAFQ